MERWNLVPSDEVLGPSSRRLNSFSRERSLLISLLAALESPERARELPSEDPLLLTVARQHRLTPLLFSVAGHRLPLALAAAFRRDRIDTAARNLFLGQVAAECIEAFDGAGVRTIVLKGLAYEATIYQPGGIRPTADVDLLVPNETRRTAFEILNSLGFEPRAAAPGFDDPDYHEVAWTRGQVEVDLHLALAPLARCRIDYRAIWGEAQPLRLGNRDTLALAPAHAAIFQALHMAIDHFDVPAVYLVDLARLLPGPHDLEAARSLADRWHCLRPLRSAATLTSSFLSSWLRGPKTDLTGIRARIVTRFAAAPRVPRPEQLLRKLAHFDTVRDAIRYVAVQSRRNARETIQRRLLRRSARERLALGRVSRPGPRSAGMRDRGD